jgi:hypothetical protein
MSSTPQRSEDAQANGRSYDEIQKSAEIKEYLETKISELEDELQKLRDMLQIVDSNLRAKSFIPAISLRSQSSDSSATSATEGVSTKRVPKAPDQDSRANERKSEAIQAPNQKQLRRTKDSMVLGNALIESDKVIIVPEKDVLLSQHTPPFESFFVNRILRGFQARDEEEVKAGKLKGSHVLQYNVQEAQGSITSVTVSNYRDTARLNEILSTVTWAFTRMLEKK